MSAALPAIAQPYERREQTRTRVGFSVFLFHDGAPAALGTANNASARGMLVTPLPHFADSPLPRRDLQLGFGVEHNGITRRYRVPVRIVHRGPAGIGLAFESPGRDIVVAVRAAASSAGDAGEASGGS